MKKLSLTAILTFLLINYGFAQTKLGLKLAPTFVVNRLDVTSGTASASKNGTGFTGEFGLIIDNPISESENYYFSSGLLYLSKTVKFSVNDASEGKFDNDYHLQYLRVPVSLKLLTNEIALDKRIYFQIGGNIDVKIHDKCDQTDLVAINKFNPIDLSFLFAAGMEFKLGTSTIFFAGLNFNHGLVDVVKDTSGDYFKNLTVKNNSVGIDVGLKF